MRGRERGGQVLLLREDDFLLVAEVAKAGGAPDISAIGDIGDGDGGEPVLGEELVGGASANPHVSCMRDLDHDVLPRLAGFIGNAGLQLRRATDATPDGIESTFAVNVLANYVLVEELREHFTAAARIVLTTSDTHFGALKHNMGMVPAPQWRDPSGLSAPGTAENADSAVAGRTAYSTSKLGLIYLTHALATRLPAGVEVFAFNPGLVPGTGRSASPARSAGSRFAGSCPS